MGKYCNPENPPESLLQKGVRGGLLGPPLIVKVNRIDKFRTMLKYNKKLTPFARELRKNMTDAEKRLWAKIRMRQMGGYQFYRQRAIGNYIVDFYCPKAKLVLEVDGGQHYSDEQIEIDKKRSSYLNKLGLKVMRFTNLDVLNN